MSNPPRPAGGGGETKSASRAPQDCPRPPQERPRPPEERPKSAQECPKKDPRPPKTAPRSPQDRPKKRNGNKTKKGNFPAHTHMHTRTQDKPFPARTGSAQQLCTAERPKSDPRAAKSDRRKTQQRPRPPQDRPRAAQERPRPPQDAPRPPQDAPRPPQDAPRAKKRLQDKSAKRVIESNPTGSLPPDPPPCLRRFSETPCA